MPDIRVKKINQIKYKCGRAGLIHSSKKYGESIYIYTGLKNPAHEKHINFTYDFKSSSIFTADSNLLHDFSGYLKALEISIKFQLNEIILCNSSCPAKAYKDLVSLSTENMYNSFIGVGAKSFYRLSPLEICLFPHIQTYAMRLTGKEIILFVYNFILSESEKIENYSNLNDIEFKNSLIHNCEIGVNRALKESGFCRYYLDSNLNLLKTPNNITFKYPFFDSRKNDSRFTS